jgi:phosphate transport system substrate-binding protein
MKTRYKYSAVVFTIALCSAIYFFGCDYYKVKSVTTIGDITIGVDETESPVIKKEADEFMRLNPESKIVMPLKTTNELMADLLNGDMKTVIVNRDFNAQENEHLTQTKKEVKKNKLAINAIGVIINPANPITKLNYTELRKIFTGGITDWKDLDGDNKDVYKGKLKVFIARKNSGIHEIFKEKALGWQEYSKGDVVCSTSTQMLNEIKNNVNGIGFISMSWITKFADTLLQDVKPVKIAPVDSAGNAGSYVSLHQAYIANKEYPLNFDVYIMSRDFDMNVAVGFTSFLLSYDGQKIILNSGLVPVTQPVRIIQLN